MRTQRLTRLVQLLWPLTLAAWLGLGAALVIALRARIWPAVGGVLAALPLLVVVSAVVVFATLARDARSRR